MGERLGEYVRGLVYLLEDGWEVGWVCERLGEPGIAWRTVWELGWVCESLCGRKVFERLGEYLRSWVYLWEVGWVHERLGESVSCWVSLWAIEIRQHSNSWLAWSRLGWVIFVSMRMGEEKLDQDGLHCKFWILSFLYLETEAIYVLWLNHETLGNTKLHFQVLASLPNSVTKSYQSW